MPRPVQTRHQLGIMDSLVPPNDLRLSSDLYRHFCLGLVECDNLHLAIEHGGARRTLLRIRNVLDSLIIDVADCQGLQGELLVCSLRMLDDHHRVIQPDIVWCAELEWWSLDGRFQPNHRPVMICIVGNGVDSSFRTSAVPANASS